MKTKKIIVLFVTSRSFHERTGNMTPPNYLEELSGVMGVVNFLKIKTSFSFAILIKYDLAI